MNAEHRLRLAIRRFSKDGRSRNPKDTRPQRQEVAQAIGMAPNQFSRWLAGGSGGPQVADLDALAKVLERPIAELVDARWHEAAPLGELSDEARILAYAWESLRDSEAKRLVAEQVRMLTDRLRLRAGGDAPPNHTTTAAPPKKVRGNR